ncbi:MAG: hypothetical protein HOO96_33220 [Polyangiaceae bacterium]|nr:hypothetical protein [Polyangiaceae bacterium]
MSRTTLARMCRPVGGALVISLAWLGGGLSNACTQQEDLPPGTGSGAKAPTEEDLKAQAKELFTQLKPELVKNCGQGCHNTAVAFKSAPLFLAPPDEYASIKGANGMVTEDATASPLLNKGEHEGPALASFADLATKVFTWLRFEADAQGKKILPSSAFVAINAGANEIDMSPAGVAGVKIRFDAAMPSGILSITKLRVFVPDVGVKKGAKIKRPLFYRLRKDNKLYVDPVDSFSYVDAVFPGGVETPLPPGSAIFAVPEAWTPFQAGEKIRIQVEKMELGDVVDPPKLPACKNAAMFNTLLMPSLTGQGVGTGVTCSGCHSANRGLNPVVVPADANATCINFTGFVNKTTPGQSRTILKAADGATTHAGGKVTDTNGFTTTWTGAITGGQIFE